jgi:hypothetical protein
MELQIKDDWEGEDELVAKINGDDYLEGEEYEVYKDFDEEFLIFLL